MSGIALMYGTVSACISMVMELLELPALLPRCCVLGSKWTFDDTLQLVLHNLMRYLMITNTYALTLENSTQPRHFSDCHARHN